MQRHNAFTLPLERTRYVNRSRSTIKFRFEATALSACFPRKQPSCDSVTARNSRTKLRRRCISHARRYGGTFSKVFFPHFETSAFDVYRYPIAEQRIPLMHLFFAESIPSTPVFGTSIIGTNGKVVLRFQIRTEYHAGMYIPNDSGKWTFHDRNGWFQEVCFNQILRIYILFEFWEFKLNIILQSFLREYLNLCFRLSIDYF